MYLHTTRNQSSEFTLNGNKNGIIEKKFKQSQPEPAARASIAPVGTFFGLAIPPYLLYVFSHVWSNDLTS